MNPLESTIDMRDPHVEWLRFKVGSRSNVSYDQPPPLNFRLGSFDCHLESGFLTCTPTEHFASIEDARREIEDFLRAWEIEVSLTVGPGEIQFAYENAEVIDRNPPGPGEPQVVKLGTATVRVSAGGAIAILVARRSYPPPPSRFRLTPDVQTLWQRYQGYLNGREPLLAMAYFCLTVLEAAGNGRSGAGAMYGIDSAVLNKLGELTSTRGDVANARKASRSGAHSTLNDREKNWIEQTVKALIHRVGEYGSGSSTAKLTLADLPTL